MVHTPYLPIAFCLSNLNGFAYNKLPSLSLAVTFIKFSPSTGYYFIAWSFGTSNGNGGGNYSSINLNYLPSNSNEPYNDASAIVVANPGQNYTSFVNGVVKISTANTGGSSSPNGDFIVLAYQHVFTGGSVSNKQVLTIVKLGNL